MTCSIIFDERVNDNKTSPTHMVDCEKHFNTLKAFGEVMLKHHIAPATFKDKKRLKAYFNSIDFLCFDFDDGTLSQKIHDDCVIKQWNHLIVGSKNHLQDKNNGKGIIERFHLFIPLQEPITNADLYTYSVECHGDLMHWNYDRAITGCDRFFYKHTQVLYCEEGLNNIDGNIFRKRSGIYYTRKKIEAMPKLTPQWLQKNCIRNKYMNVV